MDVIDTVVSLLIAGASLYGLGVPLAWLLPAPDHAAWVYRIAVAPLFAVAFTYPVGLVLGWLTVPLSPIQLLACAAALWAIAWPRMRTSRSQPPNLRPPLRWVPAAIVAITSATWLVSLVGYGLYLPNRDFKNHAFYVAAAADTRSADPALIQRVTPLSPPNETDFYPLGLHTLLGWALPTPEWNSLGVTAGSAVLIVSVSLPLAGIALARCLAPDRVALWVVAGIASGLSPGMTGDFQIGSVVLMTGAALYAAALVTLWQWLDRPDPPRTVALAAAGIGLLLLHIAEAWGLLVVTAMSVVALKGRHVARLPARHLVLLAAAGVAVVAVGLVVAGRLGGVLQAGDWDIEPDTLNPVETSAVAFLLQPGGPATLSLVWAVFALTGAVLLVVERLPKFPLVALIVPMGLAFLASGSAVPEILSVATAPWYGSTSRIYLMAGPPLVLLGALALTHLCSTADSGSNRGGRAWMLRTVPAGIIVVFIAAMASAGLHERRVDLAASLAGAGDTPRVAEQLAQSLEPGQTVLNFEGDGTANLYSAARVPVLAGLKEWRGPVASSRDYQWLVQSLLRLDDPEVAASLDDLGVAYVAVGTTSIFWDPEVGYDVDMLLAQPQLTEYLRGTDLVILRYEGDS